MYTSNTEDGMCHRRRLNRAMDVCLCAEKELQVVKWHKGFILKFVLSFKQYAMSFAMCINWRQTGVTLARTFSKEAGLTSEKQIKNTSWRKQRTLNMLPQQQWHSFNIPVDAPIVELRGLIWTQAEYNMDSTFPPCNSLEQGRSVAKTKDLKQEPPFTSSSRLPDSV